MGFFLFLFSSFFPGTETWLDSLKVSVNFTSNPGASTCLICSILDSLFKHHFSNSDCCIVDFVAVSICHLFKTNLLKREHSRPFVSPALKQPPSNPKLAAVTRQVALVLTVGSARRLFTCHSATAGQTKFNVLQTLSSFTGRRYVSAKAHTVWSL